MKYCIECGSPLINCGATKLRCDECQRRRKRMLDRERNAKKKKRESNREALARIAKEANAKGMSYGQYVANYYNSNK